VVLDLKPDTDTITADDSLQLTATAFDADGNSWEVTTVIIWNAEGPETVSFFNGRFQPVRAGDYIIHAVYSGTTDTSTVAVMHGATVRLEVLPARDTLTTDSSLNLAAVAYDADNNSWDVTADGSTAWSATGSRSPVVAGFYQADSVGNHIVRAAYDGYADTCYLVVQHGTAVWVELTPADTTVIAGTMVPYTVTAFDADSMSWNVSFVSILQVQPDTGVMMVGTSVRAIYRGDYSVVATHSGLNDTAALHLTPDDPSRVVVTFPTTIESVVAAGTTQVDVQVTDQFGNEVLDTTRIAWSWYDPGYPNRGWGEYLHAETTNTVNGSSLTLFTVSQVPRDNFRVIARIVTDPVLADTSAEIFVVSEAVYRIEIVYADTQVVTDTTITTDNDSLTCLVVGYNVTDQFVGFFEAQWEIIGDSIGRLGEAKGYQTVLEATTPGQGWIMATVLDTGRSLIFTDSTGLITVQAGDLVRLVIDPYETTVTADDTLQFTVTGFDADSNVRTDVGVLSFNGGSAIGVLDSTGRLEATTVGVDTVVVTSSMGGISDTTGAITVVHGAMVQLEVTPDSAFIQPDSVQQFQATAYDADSNAWLITDTATWGTDDSTSTSDQGRFSQTAMGTYTIWATWGGLTDTSVVQVAHGAAETLKIIPVDTTITADDTLQLTATAYDVYGNSWNVTDTLTGSVWEIDDPASGALANGRYDPVVAGQYLIWVTYAGLADTADVTVNHGVIQRLELMPDSATISTDSTLQLTLTAYDTDNNAWDVTLSDSTQWSDDDPRAVADSGRYDPVFVGTYRVWAIHQGFTAISTITVLFGEVDSLAVVPQDTSITADDSLQYRLIVFDADRNQMEVTRTGQDRWWVDPVAGTIDSGLFDAVKASPDPWLVVGTYAGLNDTLSDTARVLVTVGDTHWVRIETAPDTLGIEFGDTSVEAGERLYLYAVAYDRDSNFVCNLSLDWTGLGIQAEDSLSADTGSAVVFYPRRAGTVRLAAHHASVVGDTTGTITITASSIPGYYDIQISQRYADVDQQVVLTIVVYDKYGNQIYHYPGNTHPINITVEAQDLDGKTWFRDNLDSVVNEDNGGYIKPGTPFTNGEFILTVTYNATEESLYFVFTDDSSGVSGRSPGVIWKDPDVLSHIDAYPNPYVFGYRPPGFEETGMKISYVLKVPSEVWIRIFALEGTFVREWHFEPGDPDGGWGGLNEFYWDGRNARGRRVSSAGYVMKIWVDTHTTEGSATATKKLGIMGK
jgi:hypothetical protein